MIRSRAPASPGTRVARRCVDASAWFVTPRAPKAFAPQHHTPPSAARRHENSSPDAICSARGWASLLALIEHTISAAEALITAVRNLVARFGTASSVTVNASLTSGLFAQNLTRRRYHRRMKAVVSLAIVTAACARGGAASPSPSSAPAAVVTAPISEARRRLPIVSGCRCAYACATSVRALDGGVYEVTHDLQDSRLDRATIERWCFDRDGRGSPSRAATALQTRCFEVFYDGTPCGGECVPRTDVLRCDGAR